MHHQLTFREKTGCRTTKLVIKMSRINAKVEVGTLSTFVLAGGLPLMEPASQDPKTFKTPKPCCQVGPFYKPGTKTFFFTREAADLWNIFPKDLKQLIALLETNQAKKGRFCPKSLTEDPMRWGPLVPEPLWIPSACLELRWKGCHLHSTGHSGGPRNEAAK